MINTTLEGVLSKYIRKDAYLNLSYRKSLFIHPSFCFRPFEFSIILGINYDFDKKRWGGVEILSKTNILSFAFQVITVPLWALSEKMSVYFPASEYTIF